MATPTGRFGRSDARRWLARAALSLGLALAAAAAGHTAGTGGPALATGVSAASTLVEVEVLDSEIKPRSANIERGGTVVWKNTTKDEQTFLSEAGLFQITVKASDRFTQTFGTDGTYFYYSARDPRVQGAVVVGSGKPSFGQGSTPLSVPPAAAAPLPPIDGGYSYGGYGYGYGGYGGGYGGYGYGGGGCCGAGYGGYPGYGYGGYPGYGYSGGCCGGGYGYGGYPSYSPNFYVGGCCGYGAFAYGSSGYGGGCGCGVSPYAYTSGYGGYGYGYGYGTYSLPAIVPIVTPYYGYPGYGNPYIAGPTDVKQPTSR